MIIYDSNHALTYYKNKCLKCSNYLMKLLEMVYCIGFMIRSKVILIIIAKKR